MVEAKVSDNGILNEIGPMRPFNASYLSNVFGMSYAGAYSWMQRRVDKQTNDCYLCIGWITGKQMYCMMVPRNTPIKGLKMDNIMEPSVKADVVIV